MSSYSRSHEENKADESKPKESKPAAGDQKAPANDQAAAPPPSSPPAAAASFTGTLGVRQSAQDDQAAAPNQAAPAGAKGTGAPQKTAVMTPQTGAATQFSGLSTMQMLLNGASLTQILAGANSAQPAPTPGTPADGAADVSSKAGGDTAIPATGNSLAGALAGAASAKAGQPKSDNPKASDLKRPRDPHGPSGADLPLAAANNTLLVEPVSSGRQASGREENGPGSSKAAPEGLAAITGSAHETQQLSAAGQNENQAQTAATNFAFAVRLRSGAADASPAELEAAGAQGPIALAAQAQHVVAAVAAPGSADLPGGTAHNGEHPGAGSNETALLWAGETAAAGPAAHTGSSSATEESAPTAAAEADPAAQSEPVRNVRLQLEGENNQRVDIRLVEVAGEMRVSVRAGDTKLAQTLQEHIPDLSNRLDQQRFRAEIWSPRTESASPSSGSNVGGQSSRGGDAPGQGGQQRQGNGRQRQNQPDWVDELENYSSPATTTRSNQLWPQ